MANVKFEFDYYEDKELIEIHNQCVSVKSAIQDFDNWLRGIVKHGEEEDQKMDLEKVREKLYEFFNDNNVNIW